MTMVPQDFKDAVRDAFSSAVKRLDIDVTEAARQLRVSRQVMHRYLGGTALPSVEVLYRACLAWNLKIQYRGFEFGSCALLPMGEADRPQSVPHQPKISFEDVRTRDLALKVVSQSERHVDLQLSLKVAKG